MDSQQPNNDPKEISPTEKKKRTKYIAFVIVAFFIAVLVYMLFSFNDHKEQPASAPNETQQQAPAPIGTDQATASDTATATDSAVASDTATAQ